jgi:hypothetical protein
MMNTKMDKDQILLVSVGGFALAIVFAFLGIIVEPSPGFLARLLHSFVVLGLSVGLLGILRTLVGRYVDEDAKVTFPGFGMGMVVTITILLLALMLGGARLFM